jgi:hypothetical protein
MAKKTVKKKKADPDPAYLGPIPLRVAKRVVITGRGSDQFMVRMPKGMRTALSEAAQSNGRSMNAEIVSRLADSFLEGGTQMSAEGYAALVKRLTAGVEFLEGVLFDIRDFDLEAFIEDQQSKGTMLTRTQAIRLILRTYLSENGFVRQRFEPR